MKQLYTVWGEELEVNNVLPEYPRPTMVRESYLNLNGYWNYAITNTRDFPEDYDGEILVPFSPESVLSGVSRQLMPDQYLFYQREIEIGEGFYQSETNRLILHFGAVDQIAEVFVNGKKVWQHIGGYLPFSADISDATIIGKNQIKVRVKDYTDTSYFSKGKQKMKRGGMWYTPQSGIWQTVWLESVPGDHIKRLKFTPYYDEGEIGVHLFTPKVKCDGSDREFTNEEESKKKGSKKLEEKKSARITILAAGEVIVKESVLVNSECRVKLPSVIDWSPERPFLYDVVIEYGEDRLCSYFAMRKISVGRDSKGVLRFMLNNQPYFHHGLLDQGYWSDGLYTPPKDGAMEYDIQKMKDLGFNTLRKHIKVEPARWYYHCDRIGMLVWQDMVNGGTDYFSLFVTYFPSVFTGAARRIKDKAYGLFGRKDKEGRELFYREMKEMITCLYNHPSIVMWVPFNEGWGQFDARKATWFTRRLDSTRLVNEASGWYDQGGGDVFSIHNYFRRLKVKPNKERVVALTEYGGYSYRTEGHSFYDKVYGYRKYYSKEKLTNAFGGLLRRDVMGNIENGLSAAIYTQVSDIEEEVNGILTYDRKAVKLDEEKVKKWNERLYALVDRVYHGK